MIAGLRVFFAAARLLDRLDIRSRFRNLRNMLINVIATVICDEVR